MTEDMKKEIARERSKRYYHANKEKILLKQKKYRKERLKNATPIELEKIKKANYKRCLKYRQKNREKFVGYQRKYMAKKRELGEVPKTKDMIIKELEEENLKMKKCIEKAKQKSIHLQNTYGYILDDLTLLLDQIWW